MELLRIRVPWDGPGSKKEMLIQLMTHMDLQVYPTYPKGMLDDMSLQDIEHTPVDVLMFTSDITSAWYGTVTYLDKHIKHWVVSNLQIEKIEHI